MKSFILEVGLQILDWQEKDIQPTFSGLVKTLDGRITRNEISEAVDYLDDYFMIKQEYEAVGMRSQKVIRLTEMGEYFMQTIKKQVIKPDILEIRGRTEIRKQIQSAGISFYKSLSFCKPLQYLAGELMSQNEEYVLNHYGADETIGTQNILKNGFTDNQIIFLKDLEKIIKLKPKSNPAEHDSYYPKIRQK